MLNAPFDMAESQGLNKDQWYAATVVSNNDPDKLGRIQARVEEIFEGIPDEDLPWAIPHQWNHADGGSDTSGILVVPKKQTKVQINFQKGNPLYPVYKGYNVDKTTKLQEGDMNYPDRAVVRFQNKSLLVIDTKENIIYARSPGDCRLCVVGDLQLEVYGNVIEYIHGNVHRRIDGNLDETVKGNHKITVEGNVTEHIQGTHHVRTDGNYNESVGGTMIQASSGDATHRSGGTLALEAPTIHENSGVGAGDPGSAGDATLPTLKPWPGIRGGAKGS
jgi:Type VI secretion system/phage-baseplate injector OB domain